MRTAAVAAAALIEPGMRVGLGTGRTVAQLLPALAERGVTQLRCVATSPETQRAATALGVPVEPFDRLDRLDIAIDGADQVTPERWAVKGGHGAHLREKIVARAADRFVVIVTPDKLVDALHPPVPLELVRSGCRQPCMPCASQSSGRAHRRRPTAACWPITRSHRGPGRACLTARSDAGSRRARPVRTGARRRCHRRPTGWAIPMRLPSLS